VPILTWLNRPAWTTIQPLAGLVDNVMIVVDNLAPHVRVIPPDALVRLLAENPRP
jgi:hypothetical protein